MSNSNYNYEIFVSYNHTDYGFVHNYLIPILHSWGRKVMVDVAVLSRAARRLGWPIYIFGNDVKDYFNHLENAVSELPLMNIAWIGDGELEADARHRVIEVKPAVGAARCQE